ncbi:MAG: hypothetical protein WBH99_04335 [Azovibrio sp.]
MKWDEPERRELNLPKLHYLKIAGTNYALHGREKQRIFAHFSEMNAPIPFSLLPFSLLSGFFREFGFPG